ncbi:DUF937 domain-containing protein [Altererythrobacter sp. ZODW24]|uniref:DUF937 domain-containing protein n=1 Tax=Altererythrobacter sp. ZODW24 TaxID=2185142 RepID=UPI000DF7E785|nr:DUF937 domain-containing protein [Altererythrobacter sp. ZODW24]
MDVLDILRRTGGVNAMASELGISPRMAADGTEALLPAIMGGLSKLRDRVGQGENMEGVTAALKNSGGSSMAEAVLLPGKTDTKPGKLVLQDIFGSPQVSRVVADDAANKSSVDTETLRHMLPLLSMLVGGYISARAGSDRGEGPNDAWMGSLLDFGAVGNPLDTIMIGHEPPE